MCLACGVAGETCSSGQLHRFSSHQILLSLCVSLPLSYLRVYFRASHDACASQPCKSSMQLPLCSGRSLNKSTNQNTTLLFAQRYQFIVRSSLLKQLRRHGLTALSLPDGAGFNLHCCLGTFGLDTIKQFHFQRATRAASCHCARGPRIGTSRVHFPAQTDSDSPSWKSINPSLFSAHMWRELQIYRLCSLNRPRDALSLRLRVLCSEQVPFSNAQPSKMLQNVQKVYMVERIPLIEWLDNCGATQRDKR